MEPYKELCKELKIPLDVESTSFDLNIHVQAMIHAGSTMAINAHLLGIPAWQYGDVNAKGYETWWSDPESAISKVSPCYKDVEGLIKAVQEYKSGSNASQESLDTLEKGRYGLMDGKSIARAADVIDKIKGQFTLCWPQSTRDYSQLAILKEPRQLFTPMRCKICGHEFLIVNDSYFAKVKQYTGFKGEFRHVHGSSCPWCSARFVVEETPQ